MTACRLAEEGMSVCVLERGQAWPPGTFPRSPRDMATKGFWDPSAGRYGLFNVWSFPGFGALVSSGLGGGSLIYANVLFRKDANTFDDPDESWPVDREDLEPHYERVEPVLSGGPYPIEEQPFAGTAKTRAMKAAGDGLSQRPGHGETRFVLPNLAIAFGNEGEPPRPGVELRDAPPSVHDVEHPRLSCLLTGECDLGCNYGSKKTLDLNFLGMAKQAGATIKPSCEVTRIAPLEDGYRVTFVDHSELARTREPRRPGFPEQTMTARRLILCAGTLGTTFLMLKCRDEFPNVDQRVLGSGFSSNGDLLTFLIKARTATNGGPRILEPSYGPVITSAIRVPADDRRRGHYIEDAGYPYLLSWLVEFMTLGAAKRLVQHRFRGALDRLVGRSPDTDLGAEFAEIVGEGLLTSSSSPLLSMGRDHRGGRFTLDGGRLTSDWDPDASDDFFDELTDTLRQVAEVLGGDFRDSRIRGLSKLVTVHPLGGCPMAADEQRGVVDPFGQSFAYPGLYIADGSVMPGPVGPNPSLTIAALADRFAGSMLEERPPAASSG
ncbi:MAG: GMC oxidoreductase [Actinomycetota bacterium]|nr:GMC oxidoreductase [Actinomycetota bacterium]